MQRVLNRLVQLHLRIVIPVVRVCNLVHEREVRAVLGPALFGRVINERLDELICAALGVRVGMVKDEADDVVQLAHADDECANEVEAEFAAAALGDGVLEVGVWAGDFGDGREEEVGLGL